MMISAVTVRQFSAAFFFLCLFRSSLDPVSELFQVGGLGLGSVINFIVLFVFVITLIKFEFIINRRVFLLGGAFVLLSFFSVFYSPMKFESFKSFVVVPAYFCIFILPFYFCRSGKALLSIFRVTIYSSIIPVFVGFLEMLDLVKPSYAYNDRLFSTFYHPNALAFYLLVVISSCMFVVKSSLVKVGAKERCFVFFMMLVMVVVLLGTQTRSSWIALFLVFFIYSILAERKYLIYVVLGAVIAFSLPAVQNRISDLFEENDNIEYFEASNSLEWRQIAWSDSFSFIKEKPIVGHGYNTFSYYYPFFSRLNELRGFDAHNVYVQVTFDMGFLGLILYLSIVIGLMKRLWFYRKKDIKGISILFSLMCSYALVGYSDNLLYYLSFNWYFLLLMGGVYFYLPCLESKGP